MNAKSRFALNAVTSRLPVLIARRGGSPASPICEFALQQKMAAFRRVATFHPIITSGATPTRNLLSTRMTLLLAAIGSLVAIAIVAVAYRFEP
ncbi:MAG TPA: hypothetical protein VKV96_08230 [Roseiarcus sp.]|nr:hypothetical protein [Roseiarcus sp.]